MHLTNRSRRIRGSFVTLRHEASLRGCMGTLKAKRPLIEDVAHNAHASAARDPRFEAVTADEVDAIGYPHLGALRYGSNRVSGPLTSCLNACGPA